MAGTPLWQDDRLRPRSALSGTIRPEVCIIGAGIAGLSAAWHLAQRGIACAIVEQGAAGDGASGRNGGFLAPGSAVGYVEAQARYGHDVARRTHEATREALASITALHERAGLANELCTTGCLTVAWAEGEKSGLLRELAALRADGFPAALVAEHEVPAPVRGRDRVGIFEPDAATTHPWRWIRGFADLCERAGVAIYEGTPVAAPVSGTRFAAGTGSIDAGAVIVASDAALARLVPEFAHLLQAKRLHIIGTEPAPAGAIPIPMGYRHGYEYVQQRPDGRIVIGGFSDHDGEDGAASLTVEDTADPAVHALIERHLRDDLGVAARVTHRWTGMVGYSHDARPIAGAVPGREGVFGAGGYNGSGALNGFVAGRIVAELVGDGRSADAALYDSSRQPAARLLPGGLL